MLGNLKEQLSGASECATVTIAKKKKNTYL